MNICEIEKIYAKLPQIAALAKNLQDKKVKTIALEGLMASATPMAFAALAMRSSAVMLFILQDADEAGYFYHDLHQMMGEDTLFFPSSYRRAVKYAHRDPANEVLRTEVLTRLSQLAAQTKGGKLAASTYVVSYPEAMAEMVASRQKLDKRMLRLAVDEDYEAGKVLKSLRELGFLEVDYVYEPGQFALRGSILDVFSYNSEYPFRIDFFGDTVDSIRTFEVDTQLSKDKRTEVEIVPEMNAIEGEKVSLLQFVADSLPLTVVVKDLTFVCDTIGRVYDEGFARQALNEQLEGATEMEQKAIMKQLHKESQLLSGQAFAKEVVGLKRIELTRRPHTTPDVAITFRTQAQPLFHKNFELLKGTLEDYLLQHYQLYILADSKKQNERLKEILATEPHSVAFNPVDKTLHEGFIDHDLHVCFFTDHQIFDRYHKYNLRSDTARGGKVALTLKEIKQFELGDYVVHIDHGIGRFCGLVRMPQGDSYQEMIKLQYQNGDAVYVSIHSLYKISKYKGQDSGEPPKLSHLGTGQWERLKERTKKKLKDIARDLILLYARRRKERGFAFSADSFLQHELEASFLYEDTPDQMKATADVKADMEKHRPMDRLVCGDVGFGKTEVAVRAAFKAACDSKHCAGLPALPDVQEEASGFSCQSGLSHACPFGQTNQGGAGRPGRGEGGYPDRYAQTHRQIREIQGPGTAYHR